MIYTRLDKNNCARGGYSEEIHGKFKIGDNNNKIIITKEEYETSLNSDDFIYKINTKIKKNIVTDEDEIIDVYYKIPIIDNPNCKIPKDAIPISKELWDRHRKINKQQWTGTEWVDYIEPDDVQRDKLIKRFLSKYKKERNENINSIFVTIPIVGTNKSFSFTDKSFNSFLALFVTMDEMDTVKWNDVDGFEVTINKDNVKKILKEYSTNKNSFYLEYKSKCNNLHSKKLDELKSINM